MSQIISIIISILVIAVFVGLLLEIIRSDNDDGYIKMHPYEPGYGIDDAPETLSEQQREINAEMCSGCEIATKINCSKCY